MKVATHEKGNVGCDTLPQDLGPLHRLQECFATQPKLSSKQVRWQDTLALFNMDIRHKLVKPNALSQKHQLKVVYVGETKLQKEV
jgi:hypothetical protein